MNGYTLDDFTVTQQIADADIVGYAASHINLPPDYAKRYREQVGSLRDRLEGFIADHPDYSLVKMLHSGSVAKGTALKHVNDLDVAIYVKLASAPTAESELISWLLDRLREVYPTFGQDQFKPQDHCITITYRSGGRNVDVVPVLYEGDKDSKGYLITKSGTRVMTSIPLQLEFIRKRKSEQENDFAQLVRLVKWWIRNQKLQSEDFRFKSVMAELICAHLADKGLDASKPIDALRVFFAYIVKTGLSEIIAFPDYYDPTRIVKLADKPIQIYDPVNPDNNVANKYTEANRQMIVNAAIAALDAITTAGAATTKQEAVNMWQVVFGTTFRG